MRPDNDLLAATITSIEQARLKRAANRMWQRRRDEQPMANVMRYVKWRARYASAMAGLDIGELPMLLRRQAE